MAKVDPYAVRASQGDVVRSAEKMSEPDKPDPSERQGVRCSACGRAYPPEPMIDGRCFLCRHGISLNGSRR